MAPPDASRSLTRVRPSRLKPPPGSYTNTSAVISRISFIDGDKGILRYRGYPIEELAEQNYFEVGRPVASLCTHANAQVHVDVQRV